jgi:hypothetical protein
MEKFIKKYTSDFTKFKKYMNDNNEENGIIYKDNKLTIDKNLPDTYTFQNGLLYFNGNNVKITDTLFVNSMYLIPYVPVGIKDSSTILILSINVYFAEAIIKTNNACSIDLFILNLTNLGNLLYFKKKYPHVNVIIGAMEIPDVKITKKYDVVILDVGNRYIDPKEISNNFTHKILNEGGSITVYTLLPFRKNDKLLEMFESWYHHFSQFTNNILIDINSTKGLGLNISRIPFIYYLYNYGSTGKKEIFESIITLTWKKLSEYMNTLIKNINLQQTGGAKNLYQWGAICQTV